jgi:hypothetical protein
MHSARPTHRFQFPLGGHLPTRGRKIGEQLGILRQSQLIVWVWVQAFPQIPVGPGTDVPEMLVLVSDARSGRLSGSRPWCTFNAWGIGRRRWRPWTGPQG